MVRICNSASNQLFDLYVDILQWKLTTISTDVDSAIKVEPVRFGVGWRERSIAVLLLLKISGS